MALDTTGANELTAEQVQKILVQPLEKASVFLASGPRIFDTNGSAVRIPKQAPPVTLSWYGENEQITDVTPNFGEVILLPDTMESVKVIVKFSNELARQSIVSLDAALRDRLVTDVAATLDDAFIASTTTDGTKPLGLLNYAGRQTILTVGTLGLDDLHDAEGLALGANVDPSKLRWLMTSRDFVNLRKIKTLSTGSNEYVIQPDPTEAGAYRLLGHPVTVTNRIPANLGVGTNESKIALADFSQIAVARDLAPTVKVLDQTFADFDQMALRVVARYDAKPLNAAAVVTLEGITG